jgi:hypothetical protein
MILKESWAGDQSEYPSPYSTVAWMGVENWSGIPAFQSILGVPGVSNRVVVFICEGHGHRRHLDVVHPEACRRNSATCLQGRDAMGMPMGMAEQFASQSYDMMAKW